MTNQNEHERDATHALKRARAYPYADIQPTDAAAHAAQAIAYDLCDRRGIKYEMRQVDAEVRREIVLAHAAIIRAAIQAQASGQAVAPVGYLYQIASAHLQEGWTGWREEFSREAPPQWMIDDGKVRSVTPLGQLDPAAYPRWKCAGCGDGSGWYTSHTTGYPHELPCRRCNPNGSPKHTISQLESDPFLAARVMRNNGALAALAAAPTPEPVAVPDMADAYEGAREDVAIWKKRALEAEALNRKFLAEANGPTYMGEPVAVGQQGVTPETVWIRLIAVMEGDNGCVFPTTVGMFARAQPAISALIAAGYFAGDWNDLDGDYWIAAAGGDDVAITHFPDAFAALNDVLNEVFDSPMPSPAALDLSVDRSANLQSSAVDKPHEMQSQAALDQQAVRDADLNALQAAHGAFEDGLDADVPYSALMRLVARGWLECLRFDVTDAGRAALKSTNGGAA